MKNLNNRAKATIVMIMSFALVLSLMSCTSCDVKTEQTPVPEASALSSASVVSETSAVSEETESSEESVAISDSVTTSVATSESESTSVSTARGATPTPKPTSTPKVTATPAPTAPGRTTAQAAAPTPTPVSAGTNSAAAATPTPVPTATPTPKPTATPTPIPTKVKVVSTMQIGWDSNIRADAASRGIDLDAEAPVERGIDIYAYDPNGPYQCGADIDPSDADAAELRMYATALAFLIGFSPMVPGFITCADETGCTQETTVSETTEISGTTTEPSETAAEQTESIKSAGGEGTEYCCKLFTLYEGLRFSSTFSKVDENQILITI